MLKKRIGKSLENYSHIKGCYVNAAGGIVSEFDLNTEDMTDEEKSSYTKLLKSPVKKTGLRIESADPGNIITKIISSEALLGKSYCILLVEDRFDLSEEEEASYTLCVICPVKDSKAVLKYSSKKFRGAGTGSLLGTPLLAFTYPDFDSEGTYPDYARYYGKINEDLINNLFDPSDPPLSEESQLEILEGALAAIPDLDSKTIQRVISDSGEYTDSSDIAGTLEDMGISDKEIEVFKEKAASVTSLPLGKDITIKTAECVVKVPKEMPLETREIDGSYYILVPAGEGVTVNGIPVKP